MTTASSVPGRKSDVKDAEWLAKLLAHGLVRASFIPPAPQRELRDLVRIHKQRCKQKNNLQARYHRLRARRDGRTAIIAVAASILTAAHAMLTNAKPYRDLGNHYFIKRDEQKVVARLARRRESSATNSSPSKQRRTPHNREQGLAEPPLPKSFHGSDARPATDHHHASIGVHTRGASATCSPLCAFSRAPGSRVPQSGKAAGLGVCGDRRRTRA